MTSPRPVDLTRLEEDTSYRWRHGRDFLSLGTEDWRLIQTSEPMLRDHLRDIVETIYERFMEYEPTAQFYYDEEGNLDREAYEHRVEGFVLWFERVFDGMEESNKTYREYLSDVGDIHTDSKGFEEMAVHPFYVEMTFGLLFDEVTKRLGEEVEDESELGRRASAWQRLFLLQKDLITRRFEERGSPT